MEEKIKIIYEDNNILVLFKPAGIVTAREGRKELNTIEEWVENNRPNNLLRSGIVHRLDKGTSGILLVARDEESLIELKRQFKNRETIKKYKAMICGDVCMEGEINAPIGRSRYVFSKWSVIEDGKSARTLFNLVKKYRYQDKMYSLVDINLKTGRTHQIRVHFAYLRWSLLGDKLYGGQTVLIDRPFLHAYYLEIFHPVLKNKISFEYDMPDDLKSIINMFENNL